LPNPAVDLSKLGYTVSKDKIPYEFEHLIEDFKDRWDL